MEPNQVLSAAAEVLTDKPVVLEIDIRPQNRLHEWLQRIGLKKKKRVFEITGITYGSLIKIAPLLLDMETKYLDTGNFVESGLKAVAADSERLLMCVAQGIHNRKSDPPEWLLTCMRENFTAADLKQAVALVISKMDMLSFMTSIVSIKSANILAKPTAGATNA